MDKTEQNVKMCKQAKEIQELWVPIVGDYVVLDRFPGQGLILGITTKGHETKPLYQIEHGFNNQYKSELIWLPTQDQLQGMTRKEGEPPHGLVVRFYIWMTIDCSLKDLMQCSGSMKQLWLAFVMKENFNKTWNGEAWGTGL